MSSLLGDVLSVHHLLQHGAKHRADAKGNTPLHLAVMQGRLDAAKALIEGVPHEELGLNALNKEGQTPYSLALKGGHHALARILSEAGADTDVHLRYDPTAEEEPSSDSCVVA
jgi:ankyrin repeat protein